MITKMLAVGNKMMPLIAIMRLNKPIGSLLLLWPTMWALWIAAGGVPKIFTLFIFVLGVVVMRSAGCVINDMADRKFDGQVSRTKKRPLVNGDISLKQAFTLFVFLCLIGFVLVLQLNSYSILLSLIGVMLITLYPFAKRYTHFPQVVLGASFAWAVPMAFAAQSNLIPPIGWFLYAIAVIWPVAYDSIYALMDKEDDIKIGLKSTVIFFGKRDVLIIFLLQSITIAGLIILGLVLKMNLYYFLSVVIALGMIYHQYQLVAKKKDYYRAFVNNHWLGFIIFIGIALNYFLFSFTFIIKKIFH